MKLQEKLDRYKANFVETKPPEVVAKMKKATDDLITSGIANRALKAGEPLPPFSLPDTTERLVESAELLQKGPLVLAVYRGHW